MRRWGWRPFIALGAMLGALCACVGQGDRPAPPAAPTLAPVPGTDGLGPLPHYRMDVVLLPAEHRLKGRQQVTIPNRSGVRLEEIVFRLYPNLPQYGGRLDVGPVWVDGRRTASTLRSGNTSLVVPLARPLAPEASVTISFTFGVEIPQPPFAYVLFGHSQGFWSLPDAYPHLAVFDGQAWREDLGPPYADATFSDVAYYDVDLTLPPTLTLVATGSVMTPTVQAGGGRQYRIAGGPLRQFAWLASPDYAVAQTTSLGTVVRSYYLPGDRAAGEAALNIAAAALRVYSDEFGAYPFPEMTVAEAPLAYFGMEYPGLNLIGVDLYRDQRRELEIRVAHEIAHQWWYSQVGSDQLSTPWLDEGLAEHSTATYFRRVYGVAPANALINQRWQAPYQKAVDTGRDMVVNQPSSAFGEAFEVNVYAKAALFFEALRQDLGDKLFRDALRTYLMRYRWRIATPDDFLNVAQEVSGRTLGELYRRWILTK